MNYNRSDFALFRVAHRQHWALLLRFFLLLICRSSQRLKARKAPFSRVSNGGVVQPRRVWAQWLRSKFPKGLSFAGGDEHAAPDASTSQPINGNELGFIRTDFLDLVCCVFEFSEVRLY